MTVSTLRPSSTNSNDGAITGTTAHGALSDDSDTTLIEYDAGETSSVELGDLTLPAGALVKQVACRVRSGTNNAVTMMAQLFTSASDVMGSGFITVNWANATTTTVFTVAAGGLTAALTDANIDGSHLRISSVSGGGLLRAYEAYLDVTYVEQPSATIGTIGTAGTVDDTNQPTISWTNDLDDDGGVARAFEVKVFTDAEYGAGGFNPDTSTPTATSGAITTGANNSWQVDEILADDTYRAYVRVAQTVNGALFWSEWDTEDFTVAVDLPAVPTLTATADNDNGRITLAVAEGASGDATTDVLEVQRSLDGGTTWDHLRLLDASGQLPVPYVVATGEKSTDGADSSGFNAILPVPAGGILTGDLLIAVVGMDGNPTFTWPAGWTEVKDEAGNGSAVRASVAYRFATGTEGLVAGITLSASESGASRILCVRGADPDTPPEISTGVSASTANANPDSLNPAGWGTENTLWIAAMVNDGNVAVTAGPTGYSDFGNTRVASSTGAGVATAYKRSAAASEDPGAFTNSAEDSRAFTIAVRPLRATTTVYDYEAPNGTAVSYRARALHNYSGLFAASAWDTDSATWTSTSWWLKHPNRPALNAAVVVRSLQAVSRAGRQGVFQPLGSSGAIVVSDTRGPKTATLVLHSETIAAQDALDDLLDEHATLLLQAPAGKKGDLGYIRVGNHERAEVLATADAAHAFESLEVTVVASPPGAVVEWPS